MTDTTADYLALRRQVAAVRVPRDVIRAFGADSESFLQGQLSQDVTGMEPGESRWALLLEPQGKIDAWVRVWSRRGDEVLLDVDGGSGQAVLDRLNRFRLRVATEFELLDWECVALRGVDTPTADDPAVVAELVGEVTWAGVSGLDLLGPQVKVPADIPMASLQAYESLRIESGWPSMAAELRPGTDASVIPGEAGQWLVDASVSFTKGCYTGQELVARIDSRGNNTPRRLKGLVLGANVLPPVGAEVVVDGEVRGLLTSVGESLDLRAPVALAFVHRSVEAPADAIVRWDAPDGGPSGEAPAQVRDLPLFAD